MTTNNSNTEVAKKLNDLMGKRNHVEIYCNGFDNLVIRGTQKNVTKSVKELCMFGLKLMKMEAPDNSNPFCDGKFMAIVGKAA